MSLVLASGSPRRRMMLVTSGVPIAAVCPPQIPEVRQPNESPIDYTCRLSMEKAAAVSAVDSWVLAADTIVHIDELVFEKPRDSADAARILATLSGRWHDVTTAWCLQWSGPVMCSPSRYHGHTTSQVRFRALHDVDIAAYIAQGEGVDKAGAYGIQGLGAALVSEVKGSYANVVGLPIVPVLDALAAVGITPERT